MAKALRLHDLRGRAVFMDGYNTLITTESLLGGYPVYLCDDGFLRDTRGFFRSYRASKITVCAFSEILDLLAHARPARVEVLLDQQISRSGELAKEVGPDGRADLPGEARCAWMSTISSRCSSIVATSDGNVIDAIER
jgi:hypothetical protein